MRADLIEADWASLECRTLAFALLTLGVIGTVALVYLYYVEPKVKGRAKHFPCLTSIPRPGHNLVGRVQGKTHQALEEAYNALLIAPPGHCVLYLCNNHDSAMTLRQWFLTQFPGEFSPVTRCGRPAVRYLEDCYLLFVGTSMQHKDLEDRLRGIPCVAAVWDNHHPGYDRHNY